MAGEAYWVHYTVDKSMVSQNGTPEDRHCVAGPYTDAVEILAQYQDIKGYAGIKNAYVSDRREREPEGKP